MLKETPTELNSSNAIKTALMEFLKYTVKNVRKSTNNPRSKTILYKVFQLNRMKHTSIHQMKLSEVSNEQKILEAEELLKV